MAELTGDAFVRALQSENVTLVVGQEEEQERVTVSKTLLCYKSKFLARLVANGENTIFLPTDSVRAVKIFVQWCYQQTLQPVQPGLNRAERQKLKQELIDLWIFGARYYIMKLQNEAMVGLIALFNATNLLLMGDLTYVWLRTKGLSPQLRTLLTFALVAQIEEGQEGTMDSEDLDDVANLELRGMMKGVYESLRSWKEFQMPKLTKKDKRTKWFFFMKNEDILEALMVEETAAQMSKQGRDVEMADAKQASDGIKRKNEDGIKREDSGEGSSPWKFKKTDNGGPEVIELD